MKEDKTRSFNVDCIDFMLSVPDKFYDLAIVDPPYGIGFDGATKSSSKHGGRKAYQYKGWDSSIPNEKYFTELFRVSKNQIIWGANFFAKYLPSSMGWLFWDKGQRICNSDGELAFTSFNKAMRVVEYNRCQIQKFGGAIHPTQKPVQLYKWILNKYANEGDKILDTHGGSQSNRIACFDLGFELDILELDKEYFDQGNKRFDQHKKQLTIF